MATIEDFVQISKGVRAIYPSYVEYVKDFVGKTAELFKNLPLNQEDCTPDELIEIAKVAQGYADYNIAFFTALKNFTPSVGIATTKEAIEDLKFIKALPEIKKFGVDAYDGIIIFTTRLKMKDVFRATEFDFGMFKIVMGKNAVSVTACGENTEKNGQYHPYVKNSSLCLGEYAVPYKIAMKSLRYHAAFTAVMKCLTQYGGDKELATAAGPHNPIQLWVGQVCSVCDGQVHAENISLCNRTNRPICPSCVDLGDCKDETTGEIYHPDVLKRCTKEGCGKRTNTVIRGVCLECRQKELTL